jgi:predicted thioredoxin/glutaredoxin
MEIIIAATKSCNFRPILEEKLNKYGLNYKLRFYEENPEIFEKFETKTSPLLICNGELLSEGMPEPALIKDLCEKHGE